MDKFVEKYQPELYEMWKMGIDVASPNQELKIINRNDLQPKRKRSSISADISSSQSHRLNSSGSNKRARLDQVDSYVNQARLQYSRIEFSQPTDSAQRRHQINERNMALAGQSSRLDHLSTTDLDAAINFLPSLRCSTSLIKIAFDKFVKYYNLILKLESKILIIFFIIS